MADGLCHGRWFLRQLLACHKAVLGGGAYMDAGGGDAASHSGADRWKSRRLTQDMSGARGAVVLRLIYDEDRLPAWSPETVPQPAGVKRTDGRTNMPRVIAWAQLLRLG